MPRVILSAVEVAAERRTASSGQSQSIMRGRRQFLADLDDGSEAPTSAHAPPPAGGRMGRGRGAGGKGKGGAAVGTKSAAPLTPVDAVSSGLPDKLLNIAGKALNTGGGKGANGASAPSEALALATQACAQAVAAAKAAANAASQVQRLARQVESLGARLLKRPCARALEYHAHASHLLVRLLRR